MELGERVGVVEGFEKTGDVVGSEMVGSKVGMKIGLEEGASQDPPPQAQHASAAVRP